MDKSGAPISPYTGSNSYTGTNTESGPFGHLMNLFRSSPLGMDTTLTPNVPYSSEAPRLYQVLSFLTVPSPFVGTELQGDATTLSATTNVHFMYPPFNLTTTYREPGRINLNTIYSDLVWQGLMNDVNGLALGTTASFTNFANSRRGYTGGTWSDFDRALAGPNLLPSRFSNPFRSFSGAQLNPMPPTLLTGAEVNATLLRPDPASASVPLLNLDPTHVAGTIPDCIDTTRNPAFRYQTLTRLGNLVTTRSNVYAVWITVGYFEVEPNLGGVDAVHPDGYCLGKELGSDTGEIQRHRAFYIFDRSIPVGFQRGKDLNVSNAILLKRFIE
jgi:hypothetical protein